MASKKSTDPSVPFLEVLTSLYLADKVTPSSGKMAMESLPPTEALVLGMMCLTKTYSATGLAISLHVNYQAFNRRESAMLTEVGILGLMSRGYLRPASKAAEKALDERDTGAWGLGSVPFVVTAKGAKRIGHLVANLTGEPFKDIVKRLQAESREYAKTLAGRP